MHSLKTSGVGQILALAKPHDSVGKRTRNRIPKEERKTLVESFINKHQRLNNGSFPSLNLTHKEVGGSFYTIREIVREIIQENRVLGTSDLILDHLQDQTLSRSTIVMGPVPPLSLPPDGLHSPSDQSHNLSSEVGGNINGNRGSDILNYREENGEDVEHNSEDISRTQFAASCGEENDTKHDNVKTICDGFDVKPQAKEVEVDNKGIGFEEITFIESEGNNNDSVKDDKAPMTKMVNITKNTLGTTDLLPAETVVETSVTTTMESWDVQPSELAKVCEAEMENDSSTETCVDLGEISSSPIDGKMPNHIEKKAVNPASKGAVIGNIHETKEFINGSLKTEQTMPASGTESGSCKKDIARSEVNSVEKATVEKGKVEDASDSSNSQKANIATINRMKPESWKGQPNVARHETNPLLAVLKSFLTAFVKFWSE